MLVNLSSIELPDLPRDALSTIDDALLTIYPPPSGGLPDGVKIFFDRLGDYLQKPSSALPLLHGLRRSLKIWLSDDDGLVPVDYHARMVRVSQICKTPTQRYTYPGRTTLLRADASHWTCA